MPGRLPRFGGRPRPLAAGLFSTGACGDTGVEARSSAWMGGVVFLAFAGDACFDDVLLAVVSSDEALSFSDFSERKVGASSTSISPFASSEASVASLAFPPSSGDSAICLCLPLLLLLADSTGEGERDDAEARVDALVFLDGDGEAVLVLARLAGFDAFDSGAGDESIVLSASSSSDSS